MTINVHILPASLYGSVTKHNVYSTVSCLFQRFLLKYFGENSISQRLKLMVKRQVSLQCVFMLLCIETLKWTNDSYLVEEEIYIIFIATNMQFEIK